MLTIAYQKPYAADETNVFKLIEQPMPIATGHDLLVKVKAISVNPIDIKVRQRTAASNTIWKILGRDAVAQVTAVGEQVTDFTVGDMVFYAGSLNRDGSYAEFQLVDERIVGNKPKSISNAEAAALPLTSITAFEMLFERLKVQEAVAGQSRSILVIGAAGGVGSIAVQLLKTLTDLTVIATASRAASKQWLQQIGADHILDHSQPLVPQMQQHDLDLPSYIFSITGTDQHLAEIAELIAPQGRVGLIDDPEHFSIMPFKAKSVSIHWESMFTRSVFQTADMHEQAVILNKVAALVDEGKIKTTMNKHLGTMNAESIQQAHSLIESGQSIGKIVLEGF